jgi:hypothetical protein
VLCVVSTGQLQSVTLALIKNFCSRHDNKKQQQQITFLFALIYSKREKKTASAFGSCSPELAVVLSAFGHRETEKERSPSQKKKLQSNVTVQYISVPALTHNSLTAFLILWQISISFLQGSHKFR